jgi:hypothetical protein
MPSRILGVGPICLNVIRISGNERKAMSIQQIIEGPFGLARQMVLGNLPSDPMACFAPKGTPRYHDRKQQKKNKEFAKGIIHLDGKYWFETKQQSTNFLNLFPKGHTQAQFWDFFNYVSCTFEKTD